MKTLFFATLILGAAFTFAGTAQAQWHPDFDNVKAGKPRAQPRSRRKAVAKPAKPAAGAARTSNFSWGESGSGQQPNNQRSANGQPGGTGAAKPKTFRNNPSGGGTTQTKTGYIKFDGIDGEANKTKPTTRATLRKHRKPVTVRPNQTGGGTTQKPN